MGPNVGPKLFAAVVCGLTAGFLGRYVLIALIGAFADLLGDQEALQASADLAPFAVGILVGAICMIAPNGIGAWFRGSLLVTAIGFLVSFTALQCLGLGYFFGEILNDPFARRAALSTCQPELTAMVALMALVAALAFGAGALFSWREVQRELYDDEDGEEY
ncbi:MAG: hypothetical protein AAF439_02205 [Pseudomonadota bacterium]